MCPHFASQVVTRPNTGTSPYELDLVELREKYYRVPDEEEAIAHVKQAWTQVGHSAVCRVRAAQEFLLRRVRRDLAKCDNRYLLGMLFDQGGRSSYLSNILRPRLYGVEIVVSYYSGLRLVRRSRLQGVSEGCSGALVGIRPSSVVSSRKDCRRVPGRHDKSRAGPQGDAPITFDMDRFERNILGVH